MFKDKIRLHVDEEMISFNKSADLSQFVIRNLKGLEDEIYPKVMIQIPLKRMIGNHLMTTFFPTMCLLTISCLILYIDLHRFEVTIMVSLTAMLVMYTLHQSISEKLPKTGQIKLIDIWLLIGLVIPFMVFLGLTIIEILPETLNALSEESSAKKTMQKWARTLLVVITVTFVLAFMGGSLIYYTSN